MLDSKNIFKKYWKYPVEAVGRGEDVPPAHQRTAAYQAVRVLPAVPVPGNKSSNERQHTIYKNIKESNLSNAIQGHCPGTLSMQSTHLVPNERAGRIPHSALTT